MKMQLKTLAIAAALLALAFGAAAQQAPAGGTLDKIRSSGCLLYTSPSPRD